MGDRIVIKRATDQDVETISRIYASSWKSAYKGLIPQQFLDELEEDRWVDAFQGWLKAGSVTALLIYDKELPFGCIAYGKSRDEKLPKWGEIISIYLLPEYFGKGYGHRLLKAALNDMKSAGYDHIYLWVLEENKRAREFYIRNGFTSSNDKHAFGIKNKPLNNIRYTYSFNKKD